MMKSAYRMGPLKPAYEALRWNPIRPSVLGRAEPKIGACGIEATLRDGLASISTLESPSLVDECSCSSCSSSVIVPAATDWLARRPTAADAAAKARGGQAGPPPAVSP